MAKMAREPGEGHNSLLAADDRLRLLIERIENIEGEQKNLADDKRDVYAEGKAVGYDTKMMREMVKLRKMENRDEYFALLQTYASALGLDIL